MRLKKWWKTIALASLPIIILVGCLVTVGYWRMASLAATEDAVPAAAAQIAILPDGVVMFAPNGSVGQELTDWLESTATGSRYFEVGGEQFVGKSVEPTAAAKARLKGLVDIMNAYPRIQVSVTGFTNDQGPARDNLLVSQKRAQRVVDLVIQDGIAADRLSADGQGEHRVVGVPAAAHAERVGLTFTKK